MADSYKTNGSGEATPRRSGGSGLLKLFYLGMGVKRWLLVGAFGIAVCSIGFAYLLRKLFELRFPNFLPSYYEGILLMAVGVLTILLAIYGLYRSVGPLLLSTPNINSMADTIYARRSRGRGPRVVAIGGGTGLSVLLRGLKAHTDNLSAIVTVGDDGGSSGRLRRELGVLPPGDFRNCLVAMSDAESLVTELFQYRFNEGNGLEGHSFGNLFIAAMTNVTGSFERALYESSRVLAVHGQILPTTTANLSLSARMTDGSLVHGESLIGGREGTIERIVIEPEDAQAYPPALKAIGEAQIIVIGPGSLYTSNPTQSPGLGHRRGDTGGKRTQSCMRATWQPRRARPTGMPWPTTSRLCRGTRLPQSSTTCWQTTLPGRSASSLQVRRSSKMAVRCGTRSWSPRTSPTSAMPCGTTRPGLRVLSSTSMMVSARGHFPVGGAVRTTLARGA